VGQGSADASVEKEEKFTIDSRGTIDGNWGEAERLASAQPRLGSAMRAAMSEASPLLFLPRDTYLGKPEYYGLKLTHIK
jgi:hypothetical protein